MPTGSTGNAGSHTATRDTDTMSFAGMSLIGTSMVLVVCGLLLAVIFTNHALVRAAELRSVIAQAQAYRGAYLSFKEKFGAAPGDYPMAVAEWGNGTADGNGDGRVLGWKQEEVHAWQHLSLSNILPETDPRLEAADMVTPLPGVNIPAARKAGTGYRFTTTLKPHYGKRGGNDLELGGTMPQSPVPSRTDEDALEGGALTGSEARTLDAKIDDGLADNGEVFALRSPAGHACVNVVPTGKAATYLAGSEEVSCRMVFWLE